eukprot:TRINITY_DN8941_c0_g1_i1.p1 TRINITY_DN8941_c0_g1~~TRINITY_DN8941_c0_g1_i1.p1  ORF type:complete len:167 (+),score=9.45 TRINITY_DN8941_c0_g1_i1:161-661(+)
MSLLGVPDSYLTNLQLTTASAPPPDIDSGGQLATYRAVERRLSVLANVGSRCKTEAMRPGRRVRVPLPQGGTDTAVIRWVGYPHFSKLRPSPLVGVELEHTHGTHSGTINGHYYYQCAPRRGLFVEVDDVWTLEPHESARKQTRSAAFKVPLQMSRARDPAPCVCE